MPFKCMKCNKIVQDKEPQDCECEDNHFVKCPTIHYLHPEGDGPAFSRTQKVSNIPGKVETNVNTTLHIGCNSRRKLEQCTVLASLISCPECRTFLDSKRAPVLVQTPKQDRPLDTDKLDLTDEELKILESMQH